LAEVYTVPVLLVIIVVIIIISVYFQNITTHNTTDIEEMF